MADANAAPMPSGAASVMAVGKPAATSAAKLGPESTAVTALGISSASTSLMRLPVACSRPLAAMMTGVACIR